MTTSTQQLGRVCEHVPSKNFMLWDSIFGPQLQLWQEDTGLILGVVFSGLPLLSSSLTSPRLDKDTHLSWVHLLASVDSKMTRPHCLFIGRMITNAWIKRLLLQDFVGALIKVCGACAASYVYTNIILWSHLISSGKFLAVMNVWETKAKTKLCVWIIPLFCDTYHVNINGLLISVTSTIINGFVIKKGIFLSDLSPLRSKPKLLPWF